MNACLRDLPATLAGEALPIPAALAAYKGPMATTRHILVSLDETFGSEFAECFHSSAEFRTALIGCAPAVCSLFSRGTPMAELTPEFDESVSRRSLDDVLSMYLGASAPTADEVVGTFTSLCGDSFCWGAFESFESKPPRSASDHCLGVPPGAVEWHQDYSAAELSASFGDSRTVMLGFPAAGASDHDGTGIFTELVHLTHEFYTETLKGTSSYRGLSTGESDSKAAAALGVSDEHIIRPIFCRGQEILIYKDSEYLHRSPRSTSDAAGRARQAIWRFQ